MILNQWQEIDRNGYLASHVGNAQNIFGVEAPPRNNGDQRNNQRSGGGLNDGASHGRAGGGAGGNNCHRD